MLRRKINTMRTLFLGLALLATTVLAQDPQAIKSVCGIDDVNPTANTTLVQVGCVDYDQMSRNVPGVPWRKGKQVQVIVHVKIGDFVLVRYGNFTKRERLQTDQFGRRTALVAFDGDGLAALEIRVFLEVK